MKRLNIKLAVWLVAITLFSVVGVHFLHGYQVSRNAEYLKVEAEAARKRGDLKEAISQYNQYLKHRDDAEGYSVLSEIVVEYANQPDSSPKTRQVAYNNLSEAIRRHPERNDIRRRLIEFTMRVGAFPEALEHIKYLNDQGEKDADLDLKMARCYIASGEEDNALKLLYQLVGYDPPSGTFLAEKATAPHEVDAFEFLAQVLARKGDGKLANQVLENLVTLNPDSARAHLGLARDLIVTAELMRGQDEESKKAKIELQVRGKAELDRAFELGSDDADVIMMMASYAMMKQDTARAEELLERASKEHPERQDVYLKLPT